MDFEKKSVSETLADNFKRELPRTVFGMIGYETSTYVWRVVTGAVAIFAVWLFFGDLLPQ